MNDRDLEEARIARLLASVYAPADAAVLARVRARLAGEPDVPHLLAWLGTPAALALACMLLVVAAGVSVNLLDTEGTPSTRDASLVSALMGDDGTVGLPTAASSGVMTTDGGAVDSQQVAR